MWQGSYFHKVLRTGVHNIMILLKRMGINRSAAVVRGPADDPRHRAGGGALRRRLSARPVPQDLHPPLRESLYPLCRHQGVHRYLYSIPNFCNVRIFKASNIMLILAVLKEHFKWYY